MRRIAIRLGIVLVLLLVVSQFAIPPLVSRHVQKQLTAHGGTAHVHMTAFPAFLLLFHHGGSLRLRAQGLAVDLNQSQHDAFEQLDDFSKVDIEVTGSRAGPFTISDFRVRRLASHSYAVALSGQGSAGDVARYAGSSLGGSLGQALAGLAASALGALDQPIPFGATMQISTASGNPVASAVSGDVGGLPVGPLAPIVANALLAQL